MAVYVDDMFADFGRMKMCHMVADTHKELIEMADKIGVKRKWIQHPGTHGEYFYICRSMRDKAILFGAKEITWKDCGEFCFNRRKKEGAKELYFGIVRRG